MKTSVRLLGAVLIALASSLALPSHAQSPAAIAADKSPSADLADGEVRKVDKENRKITLKHGAIKSLDMPPMVMVFHVSDPAMLDKVQVGDKVRFAATNDAGKLTVTQIQAVK